MRFLPYSNSLHKSKYKKKKNKFKFFEILFAVIFIASFSGLLFEKISEQKLGEKFKQKSKVVTIDESKIYYNVAGEGKYTVILESDIGWTSQEWANVIKNMPKDMNILYYDRAGYGRSEVIGKDRTVKEETEELYKLLKKSGVRGPYILVGHSYGGLIMCNYAKKYPEDVAALLLIDCINEKEIQTEKFIKEIKTEKNIKNAEKIVSNLGIVRMLDSINFIHRQDDILNKLPEINSEILKTNRVSHDYCKTYYEELKGLLSYGERVQSDNILGDKPLMILTSKTKGLNNEDEEKRLTYQKELAKISSGAEVSIIDSNVKNIPIEQSNAVLNCINLLKKKVVKTNEK